MGKIITAVLTLMLAARAASAAVGCDLNDPDRDVARLFPGSTGYRTFYMSIKREGGKKLLERVEQRLGDAFRGLYETIDVPYTIYEIHKGTATAGYIHGVNQKGSYGGIQVFLCLDATGTVKFLYLQKISSKYAQKFRKAFFGSQFEGMALDDFRDYDVAVGEFPAGSRASRIKSPDMAAKADFMAVLRAVKKNLILMDEFVFRAGKENQKVLKTGSGQDRDAGSKGGAHDR